MTGYEGRRAVVTGGASGMGDATVRLLTERGAEVHVLDVREPSAAFAGFVHCDLGVPAAIDEAVEAVGSPVDAVFCCAGLPPTSAPLDVMAVNFAGNRHLIEALVPVLPSGGAVACVASIASFRWLENREWLQELVATPDFGAARRWCEGHAELIGDGYSTSKMALVAYTTSRSFTLAGAGIRINALSPGPADTAMMPHFEEAVGPGFFEKMPRPMARNTTAEEQAHALLFLNSPEASALTGVNLFNDGGITAAWLSGNAAKPVREGAGGRAQ